MSLLSSVTSLSSSFSYETMQRNNEFLMNFNVVNLPAQDHGGTYLVESPTKEENLQDTCYYYFHQTSFFSNTFLSDFINLPYMQTVVVKFWFSRNTNC